MAKTNLKIKILIKLLLKWNKFILILILKGKVNFFQTLFRLKIFHKKCLLNCF